MYRFVQVLMVSSKTKERLLSLNYWAVLCCHAVGVHRFDSWCPVLVVCKPSLRKAKGGAVCFGFAVGMLPVHRALLREPKKIALCSGSISLSYRCVSLLIWFGLQRIQALPLLKLNSVCTKKLVARDTQGIRFFVIIFQD